MTEENRVPAGDDPEVSRTVTKDMLGIEGVAPEAQKTPQPPDAMTEKPVEDVDDLRQQLAQTQSELNELQARSKQDMDALRSTLERGRHQALVEKDRQLEDAEARMHQAAIRNMDELEGLKYMQTVLEQKVQLYQDQAAEAQMRSQSQENMSSWAKGFMQMGVSYDQIDFSSPEACVQSGYAALEQNRQRDLAKVTELENELRQLKAAKATEVTPKPTSQPQAPTKAPDAPPTLGTQTGASPTGAKTMGQLLTSLESQLGYKVTEDEMWNMINSGQISRDILSGLIVE